MRQFRFVPAPLECLTVLLPLFFVAPSPPFKFRRGRSHYLRIATTGHLVKVFVRLINLITHRRCFLFARTALGSRGGFGARNGSGGGAGGSSLSRIVRSFRMRGESG